MAKYVKNNLSIWSPCSPLHSTQSIETEIFFSFSVYLSQFQKLFPAAAANFLPILFLDFFVVFLFFFWHLSTLTETTHAALEHFRHDKNGCPYTEREVSLYSLSPVLFVWIHLCSLCRINNILVWWDPNQSNRRSAVQWYFTLQSISEYSGFCHCCMGAKAFVWLDRMLHHRADPTNAMTGGDNSQTRSPLGVQVKWLTKIC